MAQRQSPPNLVTVLLWQTSWSQASETNLTLCYHWKRVTNFSTFGQKADGVLLTGTWISSPIQMATRVGFFFVMDLVRWANLIHCATTLAQEPRQGKERECVAVAEVRTACSLQQERRLWPTFRPINSYTASRTTSRKTCHIAMLAGNCHNMCFYCNTVTKKQTKQKGKEKKKKSEAAAVQQSRVVHKEKLCSTSEALATPLHSGRRQPTSFGSQSSRQRGTCHLSVLRKNLVSQAKLGTVRKTHSSFDSQQVQISM